MDGVCHTPDGEKLDRIRRLVRGSADSEFLSAMLEHLRHERQCVNALTIIQRGQNLLRASDLYPLADAEIQGIICFSLLHSLRLYHSRFA